MRNTWDELKLEYEEINSPTSDLLNRLRRKRLNDIYKENRELKQWFREHLNVVLVAK